MNTPGHAVLGLLALSRKDDPTRTWFIIAGSLVPDAPMFVFYAYQKVIARAEESVIWSEAYFRENWQTFFDIFNAAPIILLGAVIAAAAKAHRLLVLFLAMGLHVLLDFPLHHDDGHRHFWPFTDFRFESPVSYWDPAHYGGFVALAEVAFVLVGTTVLWRRHPNRWGRVALVAVCVLYVGSYVAFYGFGLAS